MESDQTSPSSLVRSSYTTTIITVEVLEGPLIPIQSRMKKQTYLEELDVVPEMLIMIHLLVRSVRRTTPIAIPSEDVDNSMLDLLRYCTEIHVITTTRRAFNLEVITVVLVEPLECLEEE